MSRRIRGEHDPFLDQIDGALARYEADHPRAAIESYRQNSASVRIRIIDPEFSSLSRAERHSAVWKYLEALDDDALGEVSVLLLLTPQETNQSFANLEFDHPVPSSL